MALMGRVPRFDCGSANGRYRRIFLLAAHPGEGRLSQPTAGAQPWPRERVLMPRNRHCPLAMRTAHNIGYWSGQVPDVCFGLRVAQDESSLCLNGARRGDHVRF
jgi:hypothetical protein